MQKYKDELVPDIENIHIPVGPNMFIKQKYHSSALCFLLKIIKLIYQMHSME
jgi:hypothetical protein